MKGSEKIQLREVFTNSQLIVPKYQRTYSWDTKQVEEMFNDLVYALENYESSDKYHYFGSFVFELDGTKDVSINKWDSYNVIDGQQRLTTVSIFVRVFIDMFSEAKNNDVGENPEQSEQSLLDTYIQQSNVDKFKPEDLSSDYYQKLVVEGKDANKFVQEDDPLVAHRLADAINCVESNLKNYLKSNTDDREERYELLEDLVKVLATKFKVTINVLDNMDEAARMFKIINERGKDLSKLDIIKSHLMYASTKVDGIDAEYISSKVNDAVREISSYPESTDKDINKFLRVHWILFTGEPRGSWYNSYDSYKDNYERYMSFDERLKEMHWYANTEREQHLELFIREYIESLEKIAPKFAKYRFATNLIQRGQIEKDIGNIFYTLDNSSSRNISAFVVAVLYTFEDSTQKHLLQLIQKPSFIYNQVLKNSGSYVRLWANLSHQIFWYKWSEDNSKRDTLFEGRNHAKLDLYTSKKNLISYIEEEIEDKNKDSSIIKRFKTQLQEPDVIQGDYTEGWGGVRKIDTIKTLLYYYEKNLRSKTGIKNMITLKEWCEKMELEHMIPENPKEGQKLSNHNEQVNRLGNFIVLAPEDNKAASNKSYSDKKQKYNTINLRMTDELPDEIDSTKLKERSQTIIDTLINEFK